MTVGIKDNKRTTSRFLHKRGHVTDAQPPPTRVNDGWSTGDTRVMYVWDAHTETQLLDLSTRELGEAGDDAACQRRTATCRSTRSIHLVVASEVDNITYIVMLRVS